MIRLMAIITAVATAAACGAAANEKTHDTLPYYDQADFTPKWAKVGHQIGGFRLTTQAGAAFTSADLAGRVHVASFIFTTCPGICPTLVRHLARVQESTSPDVLLLSYSVAPATDTPERLAEYGREHGIDPRRWLLLTGDASQIASLARESYFAADPRLDGQAPASSSAMLHTEKVLLVDGEGHVRGVYNGTVPLDIERLIGDVRTLNRPI